MNNLSENITRRSVLKGVGATTVGATGLIGLSGTATAHQIYEATFCGCSQVCACGHGEVYVWVATESDDGFDCDKVEPIDNSTQGDYDKYSFCYEVDDDEKKIIAIEDSHDKDDENDDWAGKVYENPNTCASKALEDCDGLKESKEKSDVAEGDSGGPCGEKFRRTCGEEDDEPGPPGDKPGNGPPDDKPGNGPPDDNPGRGPPDDDERGPPDDNPGRGNGGGPGK